MRRYFLTVSFIILSTIIATSQVKISGLTNEEWLQMLKRHVVKQAANPNSFSKAPHGYALYFSQVGEVNVPYLVYVPKGYNEARSHAAIVFLHGANLAREDFQYKSSERADEPIFSIADTFNTIVIFPFAKQDFKWSGEQTAAYENIITIIQKAEQNYNIDPKRIYIGGQSMGGNATYWFINNKPEMFAGFYTFSAMPGNEKFSNITKEKPLYSISAKDDNTFPYADVEAAYKQHKSETTGWHFSTVQSGGHRFIYGNNGTKSLKSLFGNLLQGGH